VALVAPASTSYPGRVFGQQRLGLRVAVCTGLAVLALGSLAYAVSPPGFKIVNTHKLPPLSALGKRPSACKSFPQTGCIQIGAYGSVHFSPHALRPGQVLTATVRPTNACHACAAMWPASGKNTMDVLFRYLKRLKCSALKCTWRAAKNAPFTRYEVTEVDISPRPPANGPSDVTDYVGLRSQFRYKYVP
jgi:hypothetical protein